MIQQSLPDRAASLKFYSEKARQALQKAADADDVDVRLAWERTAESWQRLMNDIAKPGPAASRSFLHATRA